MEVNQETQKIDNLPVGAWCHSIMVTLEGVVVKAVFLDTYRDVSIDCDRDISGEGDAQGLDPLRLQG